MSRNDAGIANVRNDPHVFFAMQNACWQGVHVESADVVSSPAGPRAHVVIQLGGLTPADVRVELTAVRMSNEELASSRDWDGRMCSTQRYENGSFVFESAPLPRDAVDWMVRVHPMDRSLSSPVEFRFSVNAA